MAESRREFLERYRFADFALKVVGVGSVGTAASCASSRDATRTTRSSSRPRRRPRRCSRTSPVRASTQPRPAGRGRPAIDAGHAGHLPWLGPGAGGRDFYFRQLWDMKGSVDTAHAAASGPRVLRRHLRVGARPCPRPERRRGRDRGVSGHERHVRWRHRGLRRDVRRSERAGLRGLPRGHQGRPGLGARRLNRAASVETDGPRRRSGGSLMSDQSTGKGRLPPRWVIRAAWTIHRAIYALTLGRMGLRRQTPERWGMMRLTTRSAAARAQRAARHPRLLRGRLRTWSPWP